MGQCSMHQKKEKNLQELESNQVFPAIVAISLPMMVTGFIDAFYNLVDSVFVGRYVGVNALAALSVNNIFYMIFLALGSLFHVGITSILSRSLGACHYQKIKDTIVVGSFFCVVLTTLLSLLTLFFLDPILLFIGSKSETLYYSRQYAKVILWVGFLIPLNTVLFGILRARGSVKLVMVFAILGAMVNIILDSVFIIIFKWEVLGAALATVIAQLCVCILSIKQVSIQYQVGYNSFNINRMSFLLMLEIFSLGVSNFIRLFMFAVMGVSVNRALSPYGNAAVASFGIVNRILHLAYQPIYWSNLGVQTLIGYNYGANRFLTVCQIMKKGMIFATLLGVVPSVVLLISPDQMFLLFTDSKDILLYAKVASRIMGTTFFLYGIQIFSSGSLLAMGHPKTAFLLSVFRPCLMVLLINILPMFINIYGIWGSIPLTDILSTIISLIVIFKEIVLLRVRERKMRDLI